LRKNKNSVDVRVYAIANGISTNLYLPAIGTAGFERAAVNGYNLVPAPPPRITATTDF
jgi:hypothetical protein